MAPISSRGCEPPFDAAGLEDVRVRDLKIFLALAQERHFGRAASSLYLSTASLSRALKRLEQGLSCVLFDRTTRSVRLTAEGEAFVHVARAVLDLLGSRLEA